MAQSKKVIAGNIDIVQYARVSPTGYPDGTGAVLASGDSAGLTRLTAAKTASISVPEAQRVFQTGDGGRQGSLLFPSQELPGGQMTFGWFDNDYDAFCVGHAVYAPSATSSMVPLAGADPDYTDQIILLTQQAKSKESATSGLSRYMTLLIPAANVDPQGTSGLTEREFSDAPYTITCNPASKLPWGLACAAANVGTTEAPVYRLITDYIPRLYTIIGDGTEDEFTLPHLPKSDHSGDYFSIFTFSTGADASALLASVSTSTGVVAFTAPPVDGVVYVCYYQSDLT